MGHCVPTCSSSNGGGARHSAAGGETDVCGAGEPWERGRERHGTGTERERRGREEWMRAARVRGHCVPTCSSSNGGGARHSAAGGETDVCGAGEPWERGRERHGTGTERERRGREEWMRAARVRGHCVPTCSSSNGGGARHSAAGGETDVCGAGEVWERGSAGQGTGTERERGGSEEWKSAASVRGHCVPTCSSSNGGGARHSAAGGETDVCGAG